MNDRWLDVICLGRSSVDLYGEQIGTRLEDVQSFAKYVGGCPTNIAVGTSRLGLRAGLITRVGEEQLGNFIIESLEAEGVDTSQITRDPERLTALVLLGVRDTENFPHIFYRPDCADMALRPEHIDKSYIASANTLLVTGTHFSTAGVAAASHKAMEAARAAQTRIVIDLDYRPVLWGLGGHAAGESRFAACHRITSTYLDIVKDCDLVVGTEEEFRIAGGEESTAAAMRRVRQATDATLVLKRGPMGCAIFDGPVPGQIDDGLVIEGRPVRVFNTLGAGDGFMSGLLRGWVRDEPLETCAQWANGTGALVVSRNGCAPAMPSWDELSAFLDGKFPDVDLRHNLGLARCHRVTTRRREWPKVAALAFDHRSQFQALAGDDQDGTARITRFKDLVATALEHTLESVDGAGAIVDGLYGSDSLVRLSHTGLWIARPVEAPGTRPLRFEHPNVGLHLKTWPSHQVAKCLVYYHPDDDDAMRAEQLGSLSRLYAACVETDRELLIEVIPPGDMPSDEKTVARALAQIYQADIFPDWWKLPPSDQERYWRAAGDVVREHDPNCRGIVVLGLNAQIDHLKSTFDCAKSESLCKGFAVGRTVFWDTAERWFGGEISDGSAIEEIEKRYRALAQCW